MRENKGQHWDSEEQKNCAVRHILKEYSDLKFRHLADRIDANIRVYPEGRRRVAQTVNRMKKSVYRELMIEDSLEKLIDLEERASQQSFNCDP